MSAHRDRGTLASCARRVYGAALRLYPLRLRERYGDDMRRTFDDRCDSAASRGAPAIVVLLSRELCDIAAASIGHRRSAISHQRSAIATARRDPVGALAQDIRYAIRMLYRQPAFTAVAVLTLGLGIGATTAVFTVVNGVLLRPLPYRDPGATVQLLYSRNGRTSMTYSPPNYHDVTTQSGAFSESAAITPASASFAGTGDPQQIEGALVTTGFFSVLGVTPRYGRGFVDADGVAGSDPVVILGDALWRRLFGARPDVVGSTMRLDGKTFTKRPRGGSRLAEIRLASKSILASAWPTACAAVRRRSSASSAT